MVDFIASVPRFGRHGAVLAFCFYGLVTVVYFGAAVAGDPAGRCICLAGSPDPGAYTWALFWWPHALVHGTNPLISHVLFFPEGANLAKTQLFPGAAMLVAPVTELFGPLVSYNLLALLSPVLAAWTAFLLCRRLTHCFWAALVGGYLFGFSSFVLTQLLGHLNLTLVFLVPVVVHVTLAAVQGELSPRVFAAALASCLVVQFLFSTEVFVTETLFGAVALALSAAIYGVRWAGLRTISIGGFAAYALTGLLLIPYLYFALQGGPAPINVARSRMFSSDLLNFVVPTPLTGIGWSQFSDVSGKFRAGGAESGAYLGVVQLVILAHFTATTWAQRRTRLLAAVFAICALASLGGRLQIAGQSVSPMPWTLLERTPILGAALPSRFVLFASLAAAVMTAIWLASGRAPAKVRAVMAIGAVTAVLPNLGPSWWNSRPTVPRFFSTSLYRRYLHPGQTALLLPFGMRGNSMLWQTEADLNFNMASGYTGGPFPDSYAAALGTRDQSATAGPNNPSTLPQFLRDHHVDYAIVDAKDDAGWPPVLAAAGLVPQRVDGVLLYAVPARLAGIAGGLDRRGP